MGTPFINSFIFSIGDTKHISFFCPFDLKIFETARFGCIIFILIYKVGKDFSVH